MTIDAIKLLDELAATSARAKAAEAELATLRATLPGLLAAERFRCAETCDYVAQKLRAETEHEMADGADDCSIVIRALSDAA